MDTNNQKKIKDELQHIISRIGRTQPKNLIEAAASYLATSKRASKQPQTTEFSKQEEAKYIEFNKCKFKIHQQIELQL